MLCGSQFGLGVRRHRWFEMSWPAFSLLPPCVHDERVVSPHGNPNRFKGSAKEWAVAMGIDWMTGPELPSRVHGAHRPATDRPSREPGVTMKPMLEWGLRLQVRASIKVLRRAIEQETEG